MIETRLNPCFLFGRFTVPLIKKDMDMSGPMAADVAILVFDREVDAPYVEVYNTNVTGSEVGKEFTLTGWG